MVWAKHRPNPNELDLNRASPRQLGQGHNDMYVNHMQNNRLIHAMRRIRFPRRSNLLRLRRMPNVASSPPAGLALGRNLVGDCEDIPAGLPRQPNS
jgi:hypothetical protein